MDIRHPRHGAEFRAHIREHLRQVGLGDEAAVGLELAGLVKMLANLYDAAIFSQAHHDKLSTARWGVLFALIAKERRGSDPTITPTFLSNILRVSKNTVSSLLRGLEEQGLIERTLDPEDRRLFRIRLTPAGRDLITSTLPVRVERMNELASGLSAEEQEQLIRLLDKLRASLMGHVGHCHQETEEHDGHGKRALIHDSDQL